MFCSMPFSLSELSVTAMRATHAVIRGNLGCYQSHLVAGNASLPLWLTSIWRLSEGHLAIRFPAHLVASYLASERKMTLLSRRVGQLLLSLWLTLFFKSPSFVKHIALSFCVWYGLYKQIALPCLGLSWHYNLKLSTDTVQRKFFNII